MNTPDNLDKDFSQNKQEPRSNTRIDNNLDDKEQPYIKYNIKTYPSDLTLWNIFEMYNKQEIKIHQFENLRREFFWTQTQASGFIESFLLGLPVPPIFLYSDQNEIKMVIDGQQRIMSIVYFLSGKWYDRKAFKLSGLCLNYGWSGKTFHNLKENEQKNLKQKTIGAINVDQLEPKDCNTSAYHIFKRLNPDRQTITSDTIKDCATQRGFLSKLKILTKVFT